MKQDISEEFRSFAVADFPTVIDFPQHMSAVYTIFYISGNKEIPIYVGETDSIQRRMGEYFSASFTMATDFKVGEAIRYFQEKGCKITIRYKGVEKQNRQGEEDGIKDKLRKLGYRLLNDLGTYKYKTANEEEEREKVTIFCDNILKSDC